MAEQVDVSQVVVEVGRTIEQKYYTSQLMAEVAWRQPLPINIDQVMVEVAFKVVQASGRVLGPPVQCI